MDKILSDSGVQRKIIQALSIIKTGSADEIASHIVELEAITSEEGVAETVIAVREQAEKLADEGKLEIIRSKHAAKRYVLIP
ncbi:MAG TPA: hypothetical protein VGE26_01800 [Sphingobacteriaceae bacterium]